ncbi:hypothetical protein JCGZ_25261 [Jatropha curcas]|uniref:Uncharacterized protein n=1 Tax=Jatropha curcas TaxID=180498 RepID=A0A067LEY2_JATCU|nr:hypothetical protein JCGZ_25261 [Jatropha curcas]
MESLVNFELNGMIAANFWAKVDFPTTVQGGDGGGLATGRRDFKRQNALLFARIMEIKSDFQSVHSKA